MGRIKFNVNEKKKTVTAYILNTEWDAWDEMRGWLGYPYENACVDVYRFAMPKKFIGSAKCNECDTWDEELGKKLALERVERSYYNAKSAAILEAMRRMTNELNSRFEKGSKMLSMYLNRAEDCGNRIDLIYDTLKKGNSENLKEGN